MPERLPHLEAKFPGMAVPGSYEKTSEYDSDYNCIAFACGDTRRRWECHGYYWPKWAIKDETYFGLESVYYWHGYRRCVDGQLEPGFEKIAIYADRFDNWTHAAHQCADGWWESKCGFEEDIRHQTPQTLEGTDYGNVVLHLKRRRVVPVGTQSFSDSADVLKRLQQLVEEEASEKNTATVTQAVLAIAREVEAIRATIKDKNPPHVLPTPGLPLPKQLP